MIDEFEKFQLKDLFKPDHSQAPTMAGLSHTDELRYRLHGRLDLRINEGEIHYIAEPPTFLRLRIGSLFFKQTGYCL